MRIDIVTIFPQMLDGFLNQSILKRAQDKKLVEINVHQLRDYIPDTFKQKQVDDYAFGGGAG
ncbi:MAG: tRNA (guanosine(37)-N1)-methyltransferase TrmD, partial [Bacteroidia bacterium]